MIRHHARTSRTPSRRGWTPYLVGVAAVCLAMLLPGLYVHAAVPEVPADLEVPAGHTLFLRHAPLVPRTTYACPPTLVLAGSFSGPRRPCSSSGGRSSPISSVPTRMRRTCPAPPGSTPGIPAGYGPLRSHRPPIRISLSQVRFPGCCSRWWERTPVLLGGPGSPRPSSYNGYALPEAWRLQPAVTRLQTSARELSCLTELSTSSTR
jgi:hypothetical protein